MEQMKIGKSMRIFVLVVGVLIWLGIWHTGFDKASWILYLPAVFFLFAAATGICPGIFFSRLIAGELNNKSGE